MPAPGHAVVSPALADAIHIYPDLQQRYPAFTTMEFDGVSYAGEFIAYIRPENREEFLARNPVVVYEFNATSPTPTPTRRVVSSPLNKPLALTVTTIAVMIPCLILMTSGLMTASSTRTVRTRLLRMIGANRWSIWRISFLELSIISLPVSLAILISWWTLAPRLVEIPVLGRSVVRGDIALKGWQVGTLAVSMVVLVSLAAFITSHVIVDRKAVSGERTRRLILSTKAIAVIAVLATTVFYSSSGSERGVMAFFGGVVLTIVFAPTIVDYCLRLAGRILENLRWVTAQLAGSQMRSLNEGQFRPYAAVSVMGIVGVLALAAFAFVNREVQFVDTTTYPSSATVTSTRSLAEVEATIETNVPGANLFRLGVDDEGREVVIAECDELSRLVNIDSTLCVNEPLTLGSFGPVFYDRNVTVLSPQNAAGVQPRAFLVVSDNLTAEELDVALRSALPPAEFAWLRVRTPESFKIRPPQANEWLQRLAVAAASLLSIVAVGSAVDQAFGRRSNLSILVKIGLSPGRLMLITLARFLVSYAVAVVVGVALGLMLANVFNREFGFVWPVKAISTYAVGLLLVGIPGGILVAKYEKELSWETRRT